MTNIGIIRKMDALGRITLPKEMRRLFKLEKDDWVEILATDEGILLRVPNVKVERTEAKGRMIYELDREKEPL